jgi:hypothetical protein
MIKSRKMRWAGHITQMIAKWKAYKTWVGKSEGKRLVAKI